MPQPSHYELIEENSRALITYGQRRASRRFPDSAIDAALHETNFYLHLVSSPSFTHSTLARLGLLPC